MLFFFRFYNKKIIYDPIDYACIDETNFWIVDDDQLVKLDVEELENLLYKEGSIPINEVEAYVHAYAHLISLYRYIYIYIYSMISPFLSQKWQSKWIINTGEHTRDKEKCEHHIYI